MNTLRQDLEIMARHNFVGLDALRGVAALVVAVGHLGHVLEVRLEIPNTALAVDFFFMLSGFVLAHAYAEKLNAGGGFAKYVEARTIRLYPMILIGTLLGASALMVLGQEPAYIMRLAVQGSLLIPEIQPSEIDPSFLPLDPPAWSLFFEMAASVLYGWGLWRRATGLTLLASTAFIIAAIVTTRTFDAGWSYHLWWVGFARVSFGFAAGIWLYKNRHKWTPPSVPLPLVTAVLLAVLLSPFTGWLYQLTCVVALFPLLILSTAACADEYVRLSKWSGEISYPLYIIHWPVYRWTSLLPVKGLVAGLLGLVTAVGLSATLLVAYDKPVRKWLAGYFRARRERFGAP